MRRPTRRARGACEHDPERVGRRDLVDERAEVEQLGRGARGEPVADVARRAGGQPPVRLVRGSLVVRPEEVAADGVEVVAAGLDPHQQAVEARDVDPRRVPSRFERLDERRARSGERVDDVPARHDVAVEQRLDELRDELAEVRVEAVDVLRALALREVRLGPREGEVEPPVQGLLRRGHARYFAAGRRGPRRRPCRARLSSGSRASRRRRGACRSARGSAGASRRGPPSRGRRGSPAGSRCRARPSRG